MQEYLSNLLSGVNFTDAIDILIVAFVIYKVLGFIRESRAEQLVQGLLLLVAATFLSGVLHLYTLNWILKTTMTLGILALVILFQPELRRGLEQMGRSKLVKPYLGQMDKDKAKAVTNEFVEAIDYLSSKKTGALIVIEMETSLLDVCETGTVINADINEEMIKTIFYDGSPLHDGAVIVRAGKLYAAGCVLPLTENKDLPQELGTRHRAGIGVTEKSDAIAIMVSEETGIISMAKDGKLERYLETKKIEKMLLSLYLNTDKVGFFSKIGLLLRRLRGKKDAEK